MNENIPLKYIKYAFYFYNLYIEHKLTFFILNSIKNNLTVVTLFFYAKRKAVASPLSS